MVEDWIGEGPAIIHWAVHDRGTQCLPWSLADMIADADELEREQEPAVVNAVSRFFTADEAQALSSVLVKETLRWDPSLRCGRVELPMTSDEALLMQQPNPNSPQTMWRIRPPAPVLPGSPLAIEGIVTLWPWPGLDPADIAPLMAMRERLGVDPLPLSPNYRPSSQSAGED